MPRISRIIAAGSPHHITQRGNYMQVVFKTEDNFMQYLKWLKEYSKKYSLRIWAYCLMDNHIHFVGVPMRDNSLAKTFNTLHMRYSQYFNKKSGLTGHLWQGRFFSSPLDEVHLYAAVRYVENNPVRAGIVSRPHEYRWSSARSRVYRERDPVLSDGCYLAEEIGDWLGYLMEEDDDKVVRNIRQKTKTGRPCGGEDFIRKLEGLIGRRLRTLPRGRPRKR